MKILITGATSGIAYDTALELAKRGHIIYLCCHHPEEKENIIAKIKPYNTNIFVYKVDVVNDDDLKILDTLEYDIIWSHAGIGLGGALLALKENTLEQNFKVNVFQNLKIITKAYNNMIKRNIAGKIFVTSSLAGYLTLEYLGSYTSSKIALSQICYTIHKELTLTNSNISLTLIEPGAYHTGFNQVMIDNKFKYSTDNNIFKEYQEEVTTKQHNLFNLIEKKNYHDLITAIIKEMEKEKPKFRIRKPLIQSIMTKLYLLIFR